MKVKAEDGNVVNVRWQYHKVPTVIGKDKKGNQITRLVDATTCYIEQKRNVLFEATVKRLNTDPVDKKFARRESLTKLLKALYHFIPPLYKKNEKSGESFMIDAGDGPERIAEMKAARKIFWDAYRALSNSPVKKGKPFMEVLETAEEDKHQAVPV